MASSVGWYVGHAHDRSVMSRMRHQRSHKVGHTWMEAQHFLHLVRAEGRGLLRGAHPCVAQPLTPVRARAAKHLDCRFSRPTEADVERSKKNHPRQVKSSQVKSNNSKSRGRTPSIRTSHEEGDVQRYKPKRIEQ